MQIRNSFVFSDGWVCTKKTWTYFKNSSEEGLSENFCQLFLRWWNENLYDRIKYFKIPLEDKYDILPNYKLFIFIVNSGSKHFANEYFRCILEQAFFLLLYF